MLTAVTHIRDYKETRNFAAQFAKEFAEKAEGGTLIRIVEDGMAHPFTFIALSPDLILYLAVMVIHADRLPLDCLRAVEKKCIPAEDNVAKGSCAGFLINFQYEGLSEAWYIPGKFVGQQIALQGSGGEISMEEIREGGT